MLVRAWGNYAAVAVGCVALGGCDSKDGQDGGAGDSGPPDSGPSLVCDPHASAPSHFVDATDAWNLGPSGLVLTGNRIISADLDGDGYPDLIVSSGPTNVRSNLDPDAGPLTQYVHVLMNRPRPDGGGRMFFDETVASGVFQVRGGSTTQLRSAQIAVAGDIDNDGDLDLFSGTYADPTHPETDTGDRSEILLNDGTGHFSLAPISDPHPGPGSLWPTSGATFVDVNRDGVLDLFVGFWYAYYGQTEYGVQAQLYEGLGDGTFVTITGSSGLTTDSYGFAQGTNSRPAYGVTSCDLDGDGSPELVVSAYGRQWNLLYQNDGTGHFTEVGQDAGYAGDDDRNYHDNQFFACYCTVHPSAPDCAGVGTPLIVCPTPAGLDWNPGSDDQPFRLNGNTFSTFCGDMNGDGKPDLYSAEIHHWHIGESSDSGQLLASTSTPGNIHFDRLPNAQTGLIVPHPKSDWNEGLLMVAGGDLDNDGRPDLIVAASDYPDQFGLIFHQLPNGTFEEVGAPWGIHHPCMSGLTVADFDRDGDLDVVVGSGTARDCSMIWKTNEIHLYQNDASQNGNWLLVRLAGDGNTTNRTGIGARVTVTAGGVPQVQQLGGGYGHMAMENDTVLFFGLGNCAAVNSIEVRWPNQTLSTDTWTVVPTNRFIELRQGDATVHVVTPAP
jgi:enediyne biosynthesis protein E4